MLVEPDRKHVEVNDSSIDYGNLRPIPLLPGEGKTDNSTIWDLKP